MKLKTKKSHREDEDDDTKKKKKSKLYGGKKRDREKEEEEDDESEDEEEEDEPRSKKGRDRDDEEDDSEDDDDSWMITDREKQRKESRRHEAEMRRNSDRPPELWIRDGEARMVQFMSDEPIAMIYRYTVPQGGRFEKVTAPALGNKDLMKRGGLRASLLAYYLVKDLTGYRDRKGKQHKNVPRLLVAAGRVQKQIEKIKEKKGDITRLEIEYSRTGSSTDTTYAFFVEGKRKPDPEAPKLLKEFRKKFRSWYRPPTVEEQRILLNGATKADEEDDD